MTAKDATVFVGDVSGAGVVATATVQFVASGVVELTMMIAANHRHRGLGTALLDRLVEWCRTNRAHKLTSPTPAAEAAGCSRYAARGRERVRSLVRYSKRGWCRLRGVREVGWCR
ncbi:GNAT family N-acetyltransferase [Nocardia albiluteola]